MWEELRSIIATTIGTQLTVSPLLIYSMGDFSLVSMPANVLVLLMIPFTMLAGFLATIVGYVSLVLAWPLSYLTHILLGWILGVSHVLGNPSFASISVPPIHGSIVVLVYLAMIMIVWRWRNSLRKSSN